jgi:hypothetical protein
VSANGTRTIVWSGGEDVFCLAKVGLILALEDKCRAGIAVIAARLETGAYYLNDVRETIRLGLIGGGMEPAKAMDKVINHVDAAALGHCQLLAYAIVQAVIIGVPDDPVGGESDSPKAAPEAVSEAGSTTTTAASVDRN